MDDELIQEVLDARAAAMDDARADAAAKVHARGKFTARERIAMLLDRDSFVEYGVLAVPGNPQIEGAADGLVQGVGVIDGSPVAAASYDYTVQGGTQSSLNHGKFDRLVELCYDRGWPLVVFADGGGARANDLGGGSLTGGGSGLSGRWGTWDGMAALSGWVPTVSIVSGRSFAGNASIAGISDVVIATRDSAIGMGGPPLVEAALGIKMTPDELGPAELHESVGGVDLMVETEAEAIEAAGRYLRYFLGDLEQYEESPQAARIRSIVPSNRRRAYDMRKVLRAVMDHGSVMELRPVWAPQAITTLARLGGRAVGVIANQPLSAIAGAIDSDASDKLARFIQLCDAYDLPMVSFIDNPGYMVGRPAEASGIARHHAGRSSRTITAPCRSTQSSCVRPTAWARRRWATATRSGTCGSPGPRRSRARWVWRARRCSCAATKSPRPTTRPKRAASATSSPRICAARARRSTPAAATNSMM